MRKLFVVLMFCLASLHSYGQMPVEILGSWIRLELCIPNDPIIGGFPMPKSPVEPPMVSLDDHTLYIYDVAYDFTLMLVDENDDVIYSTFVPANTASVVLPSTLTGTYTLQLIPNGTYYFEGEIEL